MSKLNVKEIQEGIVELNKRNFNLGDTVNYYVGRKTGYVKCKITNFCLDGSIEVEFENGKKSKEHPLSLTK